MKTVQETMENTENYARKCLMAFVEGKQTLNWIIGVLRRSGLRGRALEEVFQRLQGFGDSERLRQVREQSQREGWL